MSILYYCGTVKHYMLNKYNRNIFTKGTVTYSDIDLTFRRNPLTNDIRIKTDLDAIKQSIKNILFTDVGERPFRPDIAGRMNDLLFENFDDIIRNELEQIITVAISNYEPRVELISVDVNARDDQHELNVIIKFNMINVLEPQEISLILTRLR